MDLFETMKRTSSKEMLFWDEPKVNLKAILVINNSTLGPALCSCKMFDYASTDDAIQDALIIANYNTYRSALMHRSVGGGSLILLGDPEKIKTEEYFRVLGSFLNKLNGKVYIVSESGVNNKDLLYVKRESNYVLGLPEMYKGSGDRAIRTATGVLWGMKAAAREKFGDSSLKGLKIAIRGVGYVGKALVDVLLNEGCEIVVTDKIYDKIKEIQDKFPQVKILKPKEIIKEKVDIFSPCDSSNSITIEDAKNINCSIIAGSTNCAIEDKRVLKTLLKKDILVMPGYLINSGDIIQVANELNLYPKTKTDQELKDIYYRSLNILNRARKENIDITKLVLQEAKQYIEKISYIKSLK